MTEKIRVAYLFPGQGAQYIGMGKDLYENFDQARSVYDKANEVLQFDIKKICFEGPSEKIKQTRFAQPAIFVTSIAAMKVSESIKNSYQPVSAAGLSLGEATALVASGALDLEDGLRFVKDRGLFMDEASLKDPGTMTAVLGLSLEIVETICQKTGAEVGNLNAPGQIVISGKVEPVKEAAELCLAEGAKRCIPLDVSGAFHSSCMISACKRIEAALKNVQIKKPRFPVISNLTGEGENEPQNIRQNLVHQMNHRTLWEASMRHIIATGVKTFFELGPGKVLKGLMRKINPTVQVLTLGNLEDFNAFRK
jgi:[acyl-carrier-protein] S-malonyltransferase